MERVEADIGSDFPSIANGDRGSLLLDLPRQAGLKSFKCQRGMNKCEEVNARTLHFALTFAASAS